MYCDSVDITSDNIVNLAYLGDKYLVHRLKDWCVRSFRRHILCTDNAIKFAGLDENVIPEISNATMAYIQAFAAKIFQGHVEYDKLTCDTLQQILEKDFVNYDEYGLYCACYEWAAHQCLRDRGEPIQAKDIVEKLRDLLPLIRFPTMDLGEFVVVKSHGMLNKEDQRKVYRYIIQKRIRPMEDTTILDIPFNCVRRSHYGEFENDRHDGCDNVIPYVLCSVDVKEGAESSFCNVFSLQSHGKCKNGCLVFSVEVPVSLLAFRLQLNELVCHSYSEEDVQVKLIITRKSHGRVQSQYIESLRICPTASPEYRFHYHEARLNKPISLQAHCRYEILIKCMKILDYHEVPCDIVGNPEANLTRPFRVEWLLTKRAREEYAAVSNLIHGINYKLKNDCSSDHFWSRPNQLYRNHVFTTKMW